METGEKVPPTAREALPQIPFLLRELNKLVLIESILYRKRQDNEHISHQLVLPDELRSTVLQSLHDDMGHMGFERTLDLARTRFYWPKMAADVEHKIRTCGRCIRRKALPEKASLVNIQTSRPLELICMDFLSLEPDTSNTKDILVLTDHFTKFSLAFPTPNQKARTVAKCLWENFIVYYGIPERIHTDQGPDFESKLIKELCEVVGIKKCRTTPYHPQGNPVEHFNHTLLNMLGTLEPKQKSKWKDHVKPLVHAYNCTRNDTTGFTPYELMFGRSPPVDLAFGLPVNQGKHQPHSQYVQSLKARLQESYRIASETAAKAAEKNKTRVDLKVLPSKLEAGDRVLVRNLRLRGKHKQSDKWEQTIYTVVKQAGNLPVYTVKPERQDGPKRTLHRDLLLPCGFLPAVVYNSPNEASPVSRPQTRQQCQMPATLDDSAEEDSQLEVTLPVLVPHPMKFHREVYQVPEASFPKSAPYCLSPAPTATINSSQEPPDEHLPAGNTSLPTEVHSPESTKPVLPSVPKMTETETLVELPHEGYSPVHSTDPSSPVLTDVLANDDAEESVHSETVSESLNLEPDSVNSETIPRRSTRERVQPNRLQYSSLGNPLISVVQTLVHSLSDALKQTTTKSPIQVV